VPVSTTSDAKYLYVAPELRAGWKLGKHVELTLGLRVALMFALSQPRWISADAPVVTGTCAGVSPAPTCVRDGLAVFDSSTTSGSMFVLGTLSAGVRYLF
jgi:hypothetical protein